MSQRFILLSYHDTAEEASPDEGTSLSYNRIHYDTVSDTSFWKAIIAEFLALVLLVPLGAGSSVPWLEPNAPTVVQIALANGFMIATLLHCFTAVSGAHVNPAVTISFAVHRQISVLRCLLYVVFQCAGACLGAVILNVVTPEEVHERANGTLGCTILAPEVSAGQGFLLEFVISFQLILTIFVAVDEGRFDLKGSGALAVGLAVACGILFGFPYTGASMNPARSFGTAALQGNFTDHWIYWLAPILGGITAATFYEWFFSQRRSRPRPNH
ncbi:aquaporin AQPAn.G-like [Anneissia japonica]|uniref:aquaporin AQPAn.G-like n=1 Tax=Anneissia japonica TaxID=1529436 RepID=UPI00142566AF|nr:aquaporin AQPAn.G-like [Anneissia japonica]